MVLTCLRRFLNLAELQSNSGGWRVLVGTWRSEALQLSWRSAEELPIRQFFLHLWESNRTREHCCWSLEAVTSHLTSSPRHWGESTSPRLSVLQPDSSHERGIQLTSVELCGCNVTRSLYGSHCSPVLLVNHLFSDANLVPQFHWHFAVTNMWEFKMRFEQRSPVVGRQFWDTWLENQQESDGMQTMFSCSTTRTQKDPTLGLRSRQEFQMFLLE